MVLYELDFVNVLTLNKRRTLPSLMNWLCSLKCKEIAACYGTTH